MRSKFCVQVSTFRCAACLGPMPEVWMLVYRPVLGWEALCADCSLMFFRRAAVDILAQGSLDDQVPSS